MTKKYETLVFIGRFQPVHRAHVEIIQRAVQLARELIIIIGGDNEPRTYKNPWTSNEREMMIHNVLAQMDTNTCRVVVARNTNSIYSDTAWAARIQSIVASNRCTGDSASTAIIGHKKDTSSFYLDMFPQWGFENVELIEPLHATDIRDLYFRRDAHMAYIANVLPQPVFRMLEGWIGTPDYLQIINEREFIVEHNKQYAGLKYPPIFVTADALVICAGHVLMITRRAEPGKNLLALPGGYISADIDKSVVDAAIRELKEETKIKVPEAVIRGSIVKSKVYDAINRSPRGRIITHCYVIDLPFQGTMPKVKGSDDASKAKWVPIAEIDRANCFEDHFEMISWGISQVK